MIALWILPFAIILVFAAILLFPLAEAALPARRRHRIKCPKTGRAQLVDFSERSVFDVVAPVEVLRCSAFADPAALTCEQECVGAVPMARSRLARPRRTRPLLGRSRARKPRSGTAGLASGAVPPEWREAP